MNWRLLFSKVPDYSTTKVRSIIESEPVGSYQLIDVRQPAEYSQDHIPGAILIPLKELPDRTSELDSSKQTIVYCRSGVRSKAGAQVLTDNGFTDVANMAGGILDWKGHRAIGSELLGLEFFVNGDFNSALSMAMAMEQGLKQFYLLLADKMTDRECKDLLEFMAQLEDGHMAKLAASNPGVELTAGTEAAGEGGFDTHLFFEQYSDRLSSIEDIIQVGMMFESQAYDLYARLEKREQDLKRKEFFAAMSREEQTHLDRLAKELEKRIR